MKKGCKNYITRPTRNLFNSILIRTTWTMIKINNYSFQKKILMSP